MFTPSGLGQATVRLPRALKPGVWDATAAMSLLTLAAATLVALSTSIHGKALLTQPGGVPMAWALGWTIAALVATDIWLLLGQSRLVIRWIVVLVASCIPGFGVLYGALFASSRLGGFLFPAQFMLAVVAFRMLVTCGLAILSVLIRPVAPVRFERVGTEPQSHVQISIGELMLFTAVVAVGLVTFSTLAAFGDAVDSAELPSALALFLLVELFCFACLVMLPLFALQRSSVKVEAIPLRLVAVSALAGVLVSLGYFALRSRQIDAERVAVWLFWALFAFGCGIWFWWRYAGLIGIRVQTVASCVQGGRQARTRCNPASSVAIAVAVMTVAVFLYTHDLYALLRGDSLKTSRHVASMVHDLQSQGTNDGSFYSWRWSSSNRYVCDFHNSSFHFVCDNLRPATLFAAVPTSRTCDITLVDPHISGEVLDALAKLPVATLSLECDEIDASGFDAFCRASAVERMSLSCKDLTPDHVKSLHKARHLRRLSLHKGVGGSTHNKRFTPLHYTPEMANALRGLPLAEGGLALCVPEGDCDLSGLSDLGHLIIYDTKLTAALCRELNRPGLVQAEQFPSAQSLRNARLSFVACPDDEATINNLHAIKQEPFAVAVRVAQTRRSLRGLLSVADIPNMVGFEVNREVGAAFLSQFLIRRGSRLNECRLFGNGIQVWYSSFDPRTAEDLHLGSAVEENSGDVEAAIEQIANSVVRDSDGQVVEVDLQWLPANAEDIRQLAALPKLDRLRFGPRRYEFMQADVMEAVAELPSLRRLEITSSELTDAALQVVATMTELTHLQLPIDSYLSTTIPTVEEIPLSLPGLDAFTWDLGYQEQLIQDRMIVLHEVEPNRFEETTLDEIGNKKIPPHLRLSEVGISSLRTLTNLEHLVMPGFLLTSKTIALLRTLPKLRSLHAPMSLLPQPALKRICAVNLESLTSRSVRCG